MQIKSAFVTGATGLLVCYGFSGSITGNQRNYLALPSTIVAFGLMQLIPRQHAKVSAISTEFTKRRFRLLQDLT